MTINNIHDFLNGVIEVHKKFDTGDIWWRGEPSASDGWTLIPGVHRKKFTIQRERSFVVRFINRAHTRHERCPNLDDFPGWLFLMQHHRLLTRLLDWTESPLIAAYFAVKDEPQKPGILWALHSIQLNASQDVEGLPFPGSKNTESLFAAPFRVGVQSDEKTLAIPAVENDMRMLTQLSAFTIHGTATPLEDLPGNEKFLVRYEIPSASKAHFLTALEALAIGEANLFPDLDHLAAGIASIYDL